MQKYKALLSVERVPDLFREPNVEKGYRLYNQPWSYYFPRSLFLPHNECMNIWTHLLASLFFLGIFIQVVFESKESNIFADLERFPFLIGLSCAIFLYSASMTAHCMQSKSEYVHYMSFLFDYMGIGLYGFASGILHYTYYPSRKVSANYPLGVFLGALTTICCGGSKIFYNRPYPWHRKVWQISSVLALYFWLIAPVICNLEEYFSDPNSSFSSIREKSEWYHLTQILCFVTSGFFFGSDIPQRFFPGKCDFLGHSHAFFHCFIALSTWAQISGCYLDFQDRRFFNGSNSSASTEYGNIFRKEFNDYSTFVMTKDYFYRTHPYDILWYTITLIILQLLIILIFSFCVKEKLRRLELLQKQK